ncbi:hypothetical protein AVEN_50094-1, partial [Araneus ventricosus]
MESWGFLLRPVGQALDAAESDEDLSKMYTPQVKAQCVWFMRDKSIIQVQAELSRRQCGRNHHFPHQLFRLAGHWSQPNQIKPHHFDCWPGAVSFKDSIPKPVLHDASGVTGRSHANKPDGLETLHNLLDLGW